MVLRVPTDCGGVGRSEAAFIPGQCGWLTPALVQADTARRACSASRRRLRIYIAASPLRTALSTARTEPASARRRPGRGAAVGRLEEPRWRPRRGRGT